MLKRSFLILFIFASGLAGAQETIGYNNLVWFGDFSKTRLTEKWSVYFDAGCRRTEWLNRWSQLLVRPGMMYQTNKNISFTAGPACFSHYTGTGIRPEYRLWQQFLYSGNSGRLRWTHRVRAEQRYSKKVADEPGKYRYGNRFRYQFSLQAAITKKALEDRTLYLSFSEEIFINSGKETIRANFDQNRISAGIGYKFNERLNVLVSYIKVFAQKGVANVFENNNILVINLYHNFDLRSRKSR
jgi:Protein of unknown function (DUF2490)